MAQGHSGEVFYSDGRRYLGLHTRVVMEHEGSRGLFSAGQMWDFVNSTRWEDFGTILSYQRGLKKKPPKKKLSKRMTILCRKIIQAFPHMLIDIPGLYCMPKFTPRAHYLTLLFFFNAEHLRNSLQLVSHKLIEMAKFRQLDTIAYAEEVKKRRQEGRAVKQKGKQESRANPVSVEEKLEAEKFAHKQSNRKHKRKIQKLEKQASDYGVYCVCLRVFECMCACLCVCVCVCVCVHTSYIIWRTSHQIEKEMS